MQQGGFALDSLELYRWAVQDPETHAEVLRIMYETTNPGRRPVLLREDFAGTAAESVAWVALQPGRRAVAVDRDLPTVEWATKRAQRILAGNAGTVEFIVEDVMAVGPDRAGAADILSVLNFSILYFHDRESLDPYLAHARSCLAPGGILVLNAFGGPEAMRRRVDVYPVDPSPRLSTEAAVPPFEYVWEQRWYDAASRVADCRIHFNIADAGSGKLRQIRDAFRYDFCLWPPWEMVEALHAAGFDSVEVWRHTYNPEIGPESLFLGPVPVDVLDDLDHWTAYFVATRKEGMSDR